MIRFALASYKMEELILGMHAFIITDFSMKLSHVLLKLND